jgi:hypothetical protein
MKLTPEEKASILKAKPTPGRHTFAACPICGALSFRSTEESATPDVVVIEDASIECPRCKVAMQRSPEVVQWVMAVLGYHRRKADDANNPG